MFKTWLCPCLILMNPEIIYNYNKTRTLIKKNLNNILNTYTYIKYPKFRIQCGQIYELLFSE